MGRNKDEQIRKLQRVGNGAYSITLPINDMRELKWKENQKLTVELDKRGKRFIIRDWKKN
ncbi:hypothetical protein KJ885_01345 [Patescibacteria group bacterium]|nr:hypothetical protein [Patescibacteria group bacterium]